MADGPRSALGSIALAFLALGAAQSGAETATERARGEAIVATSGNRSELIEKLPITPRVGAETRVGMSLRPERLPELQVGDRIELSAEVQFTLNCNEKEPRCHGDPYLYDPRVRGTLILAGSRDARDGLALGPPQQVVCDQGRPREHHCVVVVTKAGLTIDSPEEVPCPLDGCFVNLVVDASHPSAGRGDVVILGGVKPNGAIPQDRGRINAVVYRPADASYPKPAETSRRRLDDIPLDLKRHVVYSQRVRGLDAGDAIVAQGSVITSVAGLPYSARTSSHLILATSRKDTRPGALARRVGGSGELGEANGFNCTRDRDICLTQKVGVLKADTAPVRGGKRKPLFVNLVMIAGAKRKEPDKGDRYPVLKRGGLAVTVHDARGG